MANPVCSVSSLVTQCYRQGTITPKMAKALKVYAKALQLQAIGGTDYRLTLTTNLIKDAAVLNCGMEKSDRDAARIHLWFVNAESAGAVVPSGIQAKVAAVKCLIETTDEQLDQADLLLTCQLGRSKAYPQ